MPNLQEKLFDQEWNEKARIKILENLKTKEYDIFVIGAGITGAGIAREAAMRNLSVVVVDMQDFSAGTSSRSSKLAHGGIRYLSHGDMDLVKEATRERNWMRVHIPHLVRPIPFLFVHLKDSKYKKRDIVAACKVYDFLSDKDSQFKNFKKYHWYSSEEVIEMEPEYIREGNLGGAVYYDNNVDDARLTIETIKEAVIRGADALNYCKVIGYLKEDGKIYGVKCKDLENNNEFEVKSKVVVNATGIWTDELVEHYPEEIPEPVIRPTKGVHLQYKREHIKNNMATIVFSISDGRAFFVLPRNERYTIIGTTDTDYKGDLSNPFCDKEDADYLIESVKYYFPNAKLDYENILSTYAGIRPLVMQKGKSESDISRKHLIFRSKDGLFTITGGKLTEWRAMAEDLFEKISKLEIFPNIKREKHFSRKEYIIALQEDEWRQSLLKFNITLDIEVSDHLYHQYGRGALKILDLIKEDHTLKDRIIDENNFIKAELLYTLRYELTTHLIDVFCRRTEMALWINHRKSTEAAKKVAEIMAKEYSWNKERTDNEIKNYLDYIKNTVSFINE